jgi:DNA polymerase
MSGPLLEDMIGDWIGCDRCPLSLTRTNVVFGDGNPDAPILLVGEAPGEKEDLMGLPYQGDAGEVLDVFLSGLHLSKTQDIFVTNVVGCRPTQEGKDYRGRLKIDNRQPNKVERDACWPRLREIIYRVDPYIIVAMGNVALSALVGKTKKITALRGQIIEITIPGRYVDLTYPVMPIFHPSYLLRNQNKSENGPWDITSGDLAEVCIVVDSLLEMYEGVDPPDRMGDSDGKEG